MQNALSKTLAGQVEKIIYRQEDSGFSVLLVKVAGQREFATVVGKIASINVGESIQAQGEWVKNKNHGLQFDAQECQVIAPTTKMGMEKYLASGQIKGIGAAAAKILLKEFGDKVFDIIENTPEKLIKLPGIGKKRAELIVESWAEQKALRDIMTFLYSHGMGAARAMRIYKLYGQEAITKITENPYRLSLDIDSIGFKTADALAQNLGISSQSPLRAEAGIRHVLQEHANNGHCAMPRLELISQAATILAIPEEIIQQAIEQELQFKHIFAETINGQECIYLASLYYAECAVAKHLRRLNKGKPAWDSMDFATVLPWVEAQTQLILSDSQKLAITQALTHKMTIITGGPGVGKTTIVNSILKILADQKLRIQLCAPTGRAAQRLSETTGIPAQTIHRLLGIMPGTKHFSHHQEEVLEIDYLVVDEMSMVDILLMSQLLKALPSDTAILLVGDIDQLPSVGAGAVLADLIASEKMPVIRLTEIFRQAAQSHIITNAHRINRGELPLKADTTAELSDFYFIAANNLDDIQDKLLELITKRIPQRFGLDPINDIQVLTPMNRDALGTRSLNVKLQAKLNPEKQMIITHFGVNYAVGDKVIQTVNNYDKDVFNGDIGRITKIEDKDNISIDFSGKLVDYSSTELDEVMLAYAITIHKSQGSEYPAIVIPLAMQHYPMLERNLIYTAITRGKKLVVIVGEPRALSLAVSRVKSTQRLTKLNERLNG